MPEVKKKKNQRKYKIIVNTSLVLTLYQSPRVNILHVSLQPSQQPLCQELLSLREDIRLGEVK